MAEKKPLKGMENITENEVFWGLRPEHRGRRVALFQLLSQNMFVKSDYDLPYEELFFGTKTLGDKVLEYLVKSYNFTKPKEILIHQARYEDDPKDERYNQIIPVSEFLEKNRGFELHEGNITVVIVIQNKQIKIFLW